VEDLGVAESAVVVDERLLLLAAAVYRLGREAMGGDYAALQIASVLGENHVKLVPDVALGGNGAGSLVDLILSRLAVPPRG
jgi:hypothetical protein